MTLHKWHPISIFKKFGIKGTSHSWHYTVWCKQNEVNRASKQNLPPILACAALNCHTTLLALEQDFTSLESSLSDSLYKWKNISSALSPYTKWHSQLGVGSVVLSVPPLMLLTWRNCREVKQCNITWRLPLSGLRCDSPGVSSVCVQSKGMVWQMVEFVQHARRSLIPCLIISGFPPPPVGRVCISHGNHFNLRKVVAQDTFVNATIQYKDTLIVHM